MPVYEMLRRMDSREVTQWRAFFAERAERAKPKPQSQAEAKAVLGAMAKVGRRGKR